MIRHIAGRQNHSVKLARKLQQKKHRRERGRLLGEGLDLLQVAYEADANILEVLIREDLFSRLPRALTDAAELNKFTQTMALVNANLADARAKCTSFVQVPASEWTGPYEAANNALDKLEDSVQKAE